MQDNNFNIDKKFTDKAWDNMQAMLDKELPVDNKPSNKPKLLPLWAAVGVAAALLIGWQFISFIGNDDVVNTTNKTTAKQIKENNNKVKTTTDIQTQPKNEIAQLFDSSVSNSTAKQNKVTKQTKIENSNRKQKTNSNQKQTNKVNKSIVKNKNTINKTAAVKPVVDAVVKSENNISTVAVNAQSKAQQTIPTEVQKPITQVVKTNTLTKQKAELNLNDNIENTAKVIAQPAEQLKVVTQSTQSLSSNPIETKTVKIGNDVVAMIDKLDAAEINSNELSLAQLSTTSLHVPEVKVKNKWKKLIKVGVGANYAFEKLYDNSLSSGPAIKAKTGSLQAKEVHAGILFQKSMCKKFGLELGFNAAYKSAKNTNKNALTAALESTDDAFKSPSGYIYNVKDYDDPASLENAVATYIVPENNESVSASIPISVIYKPFKRLSFRAGIYGSYRLNKLELANFRDLTQQRKLERSENNYTNHFDYGINSGFRFDVNRKLAFDFNYDQGFIPEIKNDNELKKNRIFQISSLINLNKI